MNGDMGRSGHRAAIDEGLDVFERLAALYIDMCPPGYNAQGSVDTFYSAPEFWEKFQGWLENAPELYPTSDKAFIESVIRIDGASIINIGTYYPWAEVEWGARAAEWVGLDNNPDVLGRARDVLRAYPEHHVTLHQADITAPVQLGRRFDCVFDLSTFDQLDPRSYRDILSNYTRLADRLIMAYDATDERPARYDFEQCGFNALLHPDTMAAMLEAMGYGIDEHRPFAHKPYRSYIKATRRASIPQEGSHERD